MKPFQLIPLCLASLLAACSSGGDNNNTTSSADPAPVVSDSNAPVDDIAVPTVYTFDSQITPGTSAVSYTGQTKRQVLIADLVTELQSLPDRSATNTGNVRDDLNFYFDFDGGVADSQPYAFALTDVAPGSLQPGPTYGDISSGKNLSGKIAGNDPALIDGEFFGWETGLDSDPTPEELVDYYFDQVDQAYRSEPFTINTTDGPVTITSSTLTATGLDLRQLIQKFLLGAVNFSQGTNDYLQTDFANATGQEDDNPYTEGEHNWDEAFGYFGAARNYGDYTDDEIRGSGDDRRAEFANGYNDANGDGLIDLRSEVNLSAAVNCAKRDVGSQTGTNFTQAAFDAFLQGRTILNKPAGVGFTEDELELLNTQVVQVSKVWEQCLAATAVHYINDVLDDMTGFSNGNFASSENFTDLAKHWSEMKGFALSLQFNPNSPFRDGTIANIDLDDLKQVLSLMGDAPVLADGTQAGVPFNGGVAEYENQLRSARTILQTAYAFADDDVANW